MTPPSSADSADPWPEAWWRCVPLLMVFALVSFLRWWDGGGPGSELILPLIVGALFSVIFVVVGARALREDIERRSPQDLFAALVLLVSVASISVEGSLTFVGAWLGLLVAGTLVWTRGQGSASSG